MKNQTEMQGVAHGKKMSIDNSRAIRKATQEDFHWSILLQEAVKHVQNYNDQILGVEAYIKEQYATENLDSLQMFVKQIVQGTNRYKKLLRVLTASFYHNNSAKALRSDATLYTIFGYICLFRLDEITFPKLEKLITSQEAVKMHVFLDFLFNLDSLRTWVFEEWCKILDFQYVEDTLFNRLERYSTNMQNLLGKLAKKAFTQVSSEEKVNQKSVTEKRRKVTVPKPFNLHKPKVQELPEPIKITKQSYVNKVPKSLYTKTLKKIEDAKEKSRLERLDQAKAKSVVQLEEWQEWPSKRNPKEVIVISGEQQNVVDLKKKVHERNKKKFEETREKVLKSREIKHPFKAKNAPKFNQKAPVRLTTAAILREDALYRKKQQKEAEVIQAYEAGLRDSTEYHRWKKEMEHRDEVQRLQAVDDRREASKQSSINAIKAMEDKRDENKKNAAMHREEIQELRKYSEEEYIASLEKKQEFVTTIKKELEEAPRLAVAKVREEKIMRGQALNEELAQLRARKAEEDRIEQEIKNDLIRQIRALERAPKQKVNVFDPTTSSGIGLLNEMSLVELHERLRMVKERDKEIEEERRNRFLDMKVQKSRELRKRMENVTRIRSLAKKQNIERRERSRISHEQKLLEAEKKAEAQTRKLVGRLRARRQQRQAEQDKLDADVKAVAKARMLLGANHKAILVKKMKDQLKGAEREIRTMQERAKKEVEEYESIKSRTQQINNKNKQAEMRAQKKKDAQRNEMVNEARKYVHDRHHQEKKKKQANVRAGKKSRAIAKREKEKRNRYAANINKKSIQQGRDFAARF